MTSSDERMYLRVLRERNAALERLRQRVQELEARLDAAEHRMAALQTEANISGRAYVERYKRAFDA